MYKTYVDEAGNTGDDLTVKEQPYFVMAAVTLDDNKQQEVRNTIEEEFNKYKEKEEIEIKGRSWCKAKNKQYALKNILNKIKESGGDIVLCILEKRYMIAAQIVQYFFDPEYNDIKDDRWISSNQKIRVETTNYYYEKLDDKVMDIIAKAYRQPTSIAFQKILQIVKSVTDKPEYMKMLNGAQEHINDEVQDECEILEEYKENYAQGIFTSSNYTSFHTTMNYIARNCKEGNYATTVIFDDANQCNKAFKDLLSYFTNSENVMEEYEIYSWRNRIDNISIEKAENNNLLQAADIVSSSVLQLILKLVKGNIKSNSFDQYILGLLCEINNNSNIHYVVSNTSAKKIYPSIEQGKFVIP